MSNDDFFTKYTIVLAECIVNLLDIQAITFYEDGFLRMNYDCPDRSPQCDLFLKGRKEPVKIYEDDYELIKTRLKKLGCISMNSADIPVKGSEVNVS